MFLSQTNPSPRMKLFFALVCNVKSVRFHVCVIKDDSKARNVGDYKSVPRQHIEKNSQHCQQPLKYTLQDQFQDTHPNLLPDFRLNFCFPPPQDQDLNKHLKLF